MPQLFFVVRLLVVDAFLVVDAGALRVVDFAAVLLAVVLAVVDFVAADLLAVDFAAVDFVAVLLEAGAFAVDLVADAVVLAEVVLLGDAALVDFAVLDRAVDLVAAAPVARAVVVLPTAVLVAAVLLAALLVAVVPTVDALGSFLSPATICFSSAPALNFGTAVFLARLRSPVRGLRTMRAGRATFSKAPNPVMATFSPLTSSRWMTSMTEASAWLASLLLPS